MSTFSWRELSHSGPVYQTVHESAVEEGTQMLTERCVTFRNPGALGQLLQELDERKETQQPHTQFGVGQTAMLTAVKRSVKEGNAKASLQQ